MGSQAVKHPVALTELLQAPENLLKPRRDAAEMLLSEHGQFRGVEVKGGVGWSC